MLLKRKSIKKPRKNPTALISSLVLKILAIISLIILKLFKNNATVNLDLASKNAINLKFLNLDPEILVPVNLFIFLLTFIILNTPAPTPFIVITLDES